MPKTKYTWENDKDTKCMNCGYIDLLRYFGKDADSNAKCPKCESHSLEIMEPESPAGIIKDQTDKVKETVTTANIINKYQEQQIKKNGG